MKYPKSTILENFNSIVFFCLSTKYVQCYIHNKNKKTLKGAVFCQKPLTKEKSIKENKVKATITEKGKKFY